MQRLHDSPAKFTTVRKAAQVLNLSYAALNRAVNAGRIPSYRPFNSRRLVLLDEVREAVRRYQSIGQAHREADHRDTIGDLFDGVES